MSFGPKRTSTDSWINIGGLASEMVRAKLIGEQPRFVDEIEHAVTTVTDQLRDEIVIRAVDCRAAELLVQRLSESDQLNDSTIRTFAEDNNIEQCVAAIAHLCNVPIEIVEIPFFRRQPETILIFARGRLSWPAAKALLLLCAKQRVFSAVQPDQLMASFDRLTLDTTKRTIECYRTQPIQSRGKRH